MENIDKLCKELQRIVGELDNLSAEYSDTYGEFMGEEFLEQNNLAGNQIDNLILASTHETASLLASYIYTLQDVVKYINFRKEFKAFSQEELILIIDKELTSPEKFLLQNKSTESILLLIATIREKRNKLFDNKPFEKITVKFTNWPKL